MIFTNLSAIFRKEFQSYFTSSFAYIIAAVFWLISGLFFGLILENIITSVAFAEKSGQLPTSVDVASEFLQSFLGIIISLLLVLLPALSMGLYSEERKRGTLELLATSPVTNWVVAVGKLLGVVCFFIVLMIPLWIYETIVFSSANPPVNLNVILIAHGGLFLVATAILSLGMFISSLTDSSILAYILTFVLVLFLWITDAIAGNLKEPLSSILSHLSLFDRYNDLVNGVVDTSSLVLFASYIFLGIFLTAQSIETFRFQRS
ncbi:ABC transporter permease [Aphanothece sacrum]|uniref:ABC-2 type transporter n=1 Tax=Aphanothece sacrum FPU1 TaxID=1920663 RepID=A0A401IDI5_APHSA|nr:ABC transporter permease [Aphanothece sacrum]GBF79347.1 ABC-2 type transporter [Aphanothece sacrum FPU1]GBF86849.1 ABC transporter family protein [Aphanothece sacrum FPU3]